MKLSLLLVLIVAWVHTYCQEITISGTVTEVGSKQPLPFVSVYINGTTHGTLSDTLGRYSLTFPLNQSSEIIYSMTGYETGYKKVTPENRIVNIELKTTIYTLNEVQIKSKQDTQWKRNLKEFKKIFFGVDRFAKAVTIENFWVLDFEENKGRLTAKASEPLKIVNPLLGYKIYTNLLKFESISTGADYLVKSFFQPFEDNENLAYEEERKKAFEGSINHLLLSLSTNTLSENGFELYTFPAKHITRELLFRDYTETRRIESNRDSTAFRTYTDSSFSFLPNSTYVVFNRRKSESQWPVFRDMPYATSVIQVKGHHRINKSGYLDTPLALALSGDMDTYGFARALPTDFVPKTLAAKTLPTAEMFLGNLNTHIHKEVFLPGERLHFSTFQSGLGFNDFQALNVCIYNEAGVKVQHHYFKFEKGVSSGHILLSKSLKEGAYYCRFFTDWMLDYPDLIKPIPFILLKEKSNGNKIFCLERLKITSNPATEMTVESSVLDNTLRRVTLHNIPLQSEVVSVALINEHSLLNADTQETIETSIPKIKIAQTTLRKLQNEKPLLTISGNLVSKSNKKPLKGYHLTIFSFDAVNQFAKEATTDEKGKFTISGLNLIGNATAFYKATDKNGRLALDIEIILNKRSSDSLKIDCNDKWQSRSITTNVSDYIISDDTLSTLLDEVMIVGNSTPAERKIEFGDERYKKTFTEDSPKFLTVTEMLEQLGGVYFDRSSGKLMVRGNVSIEPLVLVNDIALTIGSADGINRFNPQDVKSVEVLKGNAASIYGVRAAGGVIKITLKDGSPVENLDRGSSNAIDILGFTKSDVALFSGQVTRYWNPQVNYTQMKEGTFSFIVKNQKEDKLILRVLGRRFDGTCFWIISRVN